MKVEDHVRVEPKHFGLLTHEAIEKQLNEDFSEKINKEYGYVIAVLSVDKIDDGVIIPGDGAAYYNSTFNLLVWRPELHELVYSIVTEVTNFGAFMEVGPGKAMIHISQTMEDYVSVNKAGTLSGKSSGRVLGKGDECLSRIVAISFKGGMPKIGLTMRQTGLGKLQWLEDDNRKREQADKKPGKKNDKGSRKGGRK
ncbi:MAG: DNA-directed RNA polymerase [Nanoarchaeota archaeon]